ncbi:K(lysine) acetyltransferase [Rhizophlyctis rosea]|uniref:Histone acetyltransferase n=1 Tax=Rhizophlyctis rosea TaxID=64517 RepID=A0AAD5SKQ3_9FUNG|nr:K(lysine) acetyltransferase [Rhizophlyctis rosea]
MEWRFADDRRLDEWVDPDRIDSEEIQEEIASTGKSPNDITTAPNDDRKVTRNMKRKLDEMKIHKLSEIDTKFESLEREREEITKIRNIDKLHFGKYLMKTWYFSPYPDEYKELSSLYVCEFCLKYMRLPESLVQHKPCKFRRPPGRVIYEKDTLRVYEVDGKEDKVGYELSKLDGKVGSPERPLSDLGLAGYRSYWQAVLLDILRQNARDEYPTIAELSALTAIRQEDIVATLSSMNMIRYLKGDNIICVTPSMISDYIQYNAVKLERSVDPSCITYTPRRHVTPDQQVVKKRS